MASLEYIVMRCSTESSCRFGDKAVVVLATVAMLFPGYSSVICIAPGSHIAIENFNAECCASSHISSPARNRPDNGFAAAGDCRNCTDLFITPNGRSAVTESFDNASAGAPAEECFGNHLSAIASFGLSPQSAFSDIDVPAPISSSVPLRC